MNNYTRKIKEEKAAVSALVVITVLTFIAVLMGAILTVTTLRQSQIKSDMRIQDVYGADVDNVNEIYDELVGKSTDKNAPTVTITMANSTDYLFAIKSNVTISDDDSGVDYEKCKYIYTTSKDEVGTDIANYTEGELTQSSTDIEKAKGAGTYYLHVLATDNDGNSSETVSENAITIASTAEYDYATDSQGNGKEQTASLLPGTYKLECWGAQGGSASYNSKTVTGGYGAYATGILNITENKMIHINVGGKGGNVWAGGNSIKGTFSNVRKEYIKGGYNGGGSGVGGWTGAVCAQNSSSGGGCTHMAYKGGLLQSLKNNKEDVIIVAAGGGGADYFTLDNGTQYSFSNGGHGGGYLGTKYNPVNTMYEGYITEYKSATNERGGIYNYNNKGYLDRNGDFGIAGNDHAGGGAGYYGGAGTSFGGGGGSSYVSSMITNKHMTSYNYNESAENSVDTLTTSNVSQNPEIDYAKQNNGYARITNMN